MMKRWLLGLLAAAFGIWGFAQEGRGVWAEVYAQGRLVAQGSLEQASSLQLQAQGGVEVKLHLEGEVYAFTLAQMGKTLGEAKVWLNGQMVALAKVAAELRAAHEGPSLKALGHLEVWKGPPPGHTPPPGPPPTWRRP